MSSECVIIRVVYVVSELNAVRSPNCAASLVYRQAHDAVAVRIFLMREALLIITDPAMTGFQNMPCSC